MIINLFNPTTATDVSKDSRVSSDGAPAQAAAKAGSSSYAEDTTSLTSASASVENLTAIALAPDAARAAKVQSLKQAVTKGQYSVEPKQIASALSSAKV